jgi:hypothetical protein
MGDGTVVRVSTEMLRSSEITEYIPTVTIRWGLTPGLRIYDECAEVNQIPVYVYEVTLKGLKDFDGEIDVAIASGDQLIETTLTLKVTGVGGIDPRIVDDSSGSSLIIVGAILALVILLGAGFLIARK